MRRAIVALAVTVLLAGPTALAFVQGGYSDDGRLFGAVVAWLLLVVAAVLLPVPLPRRRAGRVALAGLGLLACWTAASFAWTELHYTVADALQRLLLYTAALAAAAALLRSPLARRAVEPALAAGALVAIATALSERLLPGVVHLQFERSVGALGRLELPIGYWNAMGALGAIGLVLAVRIAGDHTRPAWLRAAAAAGSVPIAVGTWLSYSRGALAALGIGLAVLVALAPTRPQLRALAVVAVAGLPAVVLANALDGVRALEGPLGTRERQGAIMFAVLAALCCGAALALWWSARAERSGRWSVSEWRLPRRTGAVAAVGIVLLAAGVVALAARDSGHAATTGATSARLRNLESNRYDYWRVALRYGFERQPLHGIGPGSFKVEWLRHRTVGEIALNPHSLYLETLSELGLVGFAMLLAFFGGVVVSARRAQRLAPALAAGPIAGFAVWAVHSAVDWDWEVPAVTLVALLLAGSLMATADEQPAAEAARSEPEATAAPAAATPAPA